MGDRPIVALEELRQSWAIVRELAAMDYIDTSTGTFTPRCRFCHGEFVTDEDSGGNLFVDAQDDDHEPGCIWIRARKLMGVG